MSVILSFFKFSFSTILKYYFNIACLNENKKVVEYILGKMEQEKLSIDERESDWSPLSIGKDFTNYLKNINFDNFLNAK